MKYVKLFVTVFVMAVAMNVSAQSKTTAKAKTTTTTTTKTTTAAPAKKAATATKPATTTAAKPATKATTTTTAKTVTASKPAKSTSVSLASSGDYDPRPRLLLEAKIGKFYGPHGAFGANIVLEKEFNKYIAWDIFSIDFSTNFSNEAFSWFPIGIKSGARAFSPSWWDGKMRAYTSLALGYECGIIKGGEDFNTTAAHGFALSWGIGVQIKRHFFIGYDLEYNSCDQWGTAHYAKFGYKF